MVWWWGIDDAYNTLLIKENEREREKEKRKIQTKI